MTLVPSVLFLFGCLLSIAHSTEWASPSDIERVLKEDNNKWNDDGFMNFQDTVSDWSTYSINTRKCLE